MRWQPWWQVPRLREAAAGTGAVMVVDTGAVMVVDTAAAVMAAVISVVTALATLTLAAAIMGV